MGKYIDLMDIVRLSQTIQGVEPLSSFARLIDGLPTQTKPTEVEWSLQGHQKAHGPALITLHVSASPQLQCQRCLGLFHYTVDADIELEVVTSVRALDADVSDSGEIDNEAYDKILANKPIDILVLVEDELILSLPYIPKHEECQDLVELPADNLEKKPSPFAVLEKLKH